MSWFLEDTKSQIYFDELLNQYLPKSRISQRIWKNLNPFLLGEEKKWQIEIDQLSDLIKNLKQNKNIITDLDHLFMKFEDIRPIFEKLSVNWDDVDPLIDFFHIKQFLWFSYSLSQTLLTLDLNENVQQTANWYKIAQKPWQTWLQLLHPTSRNFYPNFALSDIDQLLLKDLRAEKRRLVREKREAEKLHHKFYETKLKMKINYEGYLLLSISDPLLSSISNNPQFMFIREQGNEFIYYLLPSEQEKIHEMEIKKLEIKIELEEKQRLKELWQQMEPFVHLWADAHREWAKLEILVKKAEMAIDIDGTKPLLNKTERSFMMEDAIHPYLHKTWANKTNGMQPLSIIVRGGSTVLYGANMSGKTIVLRTIGLIQALAQYGFYVPAKKCQFAFVSNLTLITGDYQNIESGLSSFGAEMVRLKKDLSHRHHTFFLLDEVGKGTNPIEGEALAIAVLRYLKNAGGGFSIFVTHFPNMIVEEKVDLYEMKSFKLVNVNRGNMVYEGLSTAEKLGLPREIIETAKLYLKE